MPDSPRFVGQSVPHLDAWEKVTGRQRFMSDLSLPGALWATVVRSPYAHARVCAVDKDAVRKRPHIIDVFTAVDVPDTLFNPAAAPPSMELDASADKRLLTDEAQHVGDGVAVVVGTTRADSLAAARALPVEWEELPSILDMETALEAGDPLGQVGYGGEEADDVLATADVVVANRYYTQATQHVCLEPHACAAAPDPVDGRLTIWSNTQAPSDVRRLCAEILSMPLADIRVRKINEGGGFGAKQELYEEALVAWLAWRLQAPVQLQYTRLEEFTAGRTRHSARIDVQLGFDRDGRLLVCDIEALLDSGGYASHAPYVIGDLLAVAIYTYPHAVHRYLGTVVKTHTIPGGAYRGYGVPQAIFALEQTMDMAAARLELDPLELRRRNTTPVSDTTDAFFGVGAAGRLRACLEAGAAAFDWRGSEPVTGEDGRLYAQGLAVTTMLNITCAGLHEETHAMVRYNEDGTVTLFTGTCDCGTGSSTVLAQIVAEELRLPLAAINVREGDTNTGMVDLGSFAQRTVYVGGGAARKAAVAARQRLLDVVALTKERQRDQLALVEGGIIDLSDEDFYVPLDAFCREYATRGCIIGAASHRPDGSPPSYGVCFVEVAVDPETTDVTVTRCLIAADCGVVMNPDGARGQVYGGAVQGLGFATIERWQADDSGVGPTTLAAHGVPGMLDVPEITAVFVNMADPDGPYGAKGLGEVPVPPVAAAVANAVATATGVRPNRLPLRPGQLWTQLQQPASCSDVPFDLQPAPA